MNILKTRASLILAFCMILGMGACGASDTGSDLGYMQITAEEAKQVMESGEDHIVLDVRTDEEYEEGHIPGALLIPDYEIEEKAEEILPDKEQIILVYCRSGNRSKSASEQLVKLGYKDIREFGGINDWPYEVD